MKRVLFLALAGTCAAAWMLPAALGQDTTTNEPLPEIIGHIKRGTNSIPIAKVGGKVLEGLEREGAFNRLAYSQIESIFGKGDTNNRFLTFLKDLNLRPKIFQASGGGSNDASLGLEFDYKKSIANVELNEGSLNPLGLSLALEAKGDLAFEAENNPNNLIEANGSIHLFQGFGGVKPLYEVDTNSLRKLRQLDTQKKILEAAKDKNFRENPAYRAAVQRVTEHMRPQFFYDFQLQGGLETDQEFDNRQYVYGGKLGLVFRDWRPQSDVGFFNIPDYPFAAIRSLIKREKFQPSGRTFPSVVLGLEQVDPTDNEARLAVDSDDGAYGRVSVEVAFKTPVYDWKEDHLYFSAVYRHFQELGASSAIRGADLDRFNYFVGKLDLPFHFNISYSAGKLPLDSKTDHVYALGWTLNF